MDYRVRQRMKTRAVTIVEMLIVLAIIALIAGLVFPVVTKSKSTAQRAPCISQLRQLGMALALYDDLHEVTAGIRFPSPDVLVQSGLITDAKILVCPLDLFEGYASRFDACHGESHNYATSYETLHRFTEEHKFVRELQRADPNHGVAACRLHGNRTESFEDGLSNFCAAAWLMFDGPLLRLRKDGSVQTAKLTLHPSSEPGARRAFSLWNLFTDEPNPFQHLELRAENQSTARPLIRVR
jgi:competence protein ComGC